MATPLNIELAAGLGFAVPDGAGPNDLLITLRGDDDARVEAGLAAVETALSRGPFRRRRGHRRRAPAARYRSRCGRGAPDAPLVLLSVPGSAVLGEALDAIDAGRHVMIFSDNVPVGRRDRAQGRRRRRRGAGDGPGLRHRDHRRGRARFRQRAARTTTPARGSAWSPPPAPARSSSPACWTTPVSRSPTCSASAAVTCRRRWRPQRRRPPCGCWTPTRHRPHRADLQAAAPGRRGRGPGRRRCPGTPGDHASLIGPGQPDITAGCRAGARQRSVRRPVAGTGATWATPDDAGRGRRRRARCAGCSPAAPWPTRRWWSPAPCWVTSARTSRCGRISRCRRSGDTAGPTWPGSATSSSTSATTRSPSAGRTR